ncbi:uncharacterized protein A4U43_C03F14500 [Asparagus officinalis]|uniref:Uncharacterized protein n=1 Tax=Asparagus officinalis TaxID=4686 RepID=A0A5P1FF76_ASPOF|nr:uncharacterized protein LOC109833699 [Asparagus officinalis]XP_020257066.1 uncharacterized protein LOC109833699 [Asparagus officinalis]ONK75210.1 uncharacterized protein A4U43_C03F14500 [Asparagus officinalis]
MGRVIKGHNRRQFRLTPYPIPSNRYAQEKIDWKQAVCAVCLEAPHNAVLLLCSSHDKGCRPYMCGTNFRHSNCLDLFKKAYAKPAVTTSDSQENLSDLSWPSCKKSEPTELSCPLCRGEVKGWTIVEPARLHLNKKKRSCMEDGCSFSGTYRELQKHVKAKHPRAKPRKVDPLLEAKWRALERQTEEQDVLSTIRSSMPRSVVMGDYVIDMDSNSGSDFDDFDDDDDEDDGFDDDDDEDDGGDRGGGFLRRRRGRSSSGDFRQRFLYLLLQEGVRLARARRGIEDGGNGGGAVNYQSEEDNVHNDVGRNQERRVNLIRRRRRRGRGRGRSVFHDLMC